MKKFWKALGVAALAAAVPVRFQKDDATGEKTFQSLLVSVNVGPGEEGGTAIDINFGDGVLTQAIGSLVNAKKESKLFTEDPEEAVLFADNQPEAAVVTDDDIAEAVAEGPAAQAEETEAAKETEPTEETAEPEATEEDFDPDL